MVPASRRKNTDMTGTDSVAFPPGTQTLMRGLAVIEAVAAGHRTLTDIAATIGCSRSTTHRLASALVQAGYLRAPSSGGGQTFILGPRLVEMGFLARDTLPVVAVARPHLDALGATTRDTVHLGIREGIEVLYLDKIAGQRGLEMRSRVGKRMPIASTGLGKALMLDLPEAEWRTLYDAALSHPATPNARLPAWPEYRAGLRQSGLAACAFDFEENEPGIRCVAAAIRDATGMVIAAVSVASATVYMSETRMHELAPAVVATAQAISRELGWLPRRRAFA